MNGVAALAKATISPGRECNLFLFMYLYLCMYLLLIGVSLATDGCSLAMLGEPTPNNGVEDGLPLLCDKSKVNSGEQ